MDDVLEALLRRRDEFLAVLADASEAGVPWSRELDRPLTPAHRAWLAHEFICRRIGVDPLNPPAVLGRPPVRPADMTPERLDRDLDALADYSLHPLHEFALSRALPSAA